MTDDSGHILTAEEAAKLLGLSESATYRLLQQGDIPAGKIGGQWRVRRSDIDLAFDLARARAMAAMREKTARETWAYALEQLRERQADREQSFGKDTVEHHDFELTRCVWCPEFVPAWSTHLYTTLCSEECVAEIRRAYRVLGWPMEFELMISPIYTWYEQDNYWSIWDYRDVEHRGLFLEMSPPDEFFYEGTGPDRSLIVTRWKARHERGPLREQLVLEHPLLRAFLRERERGPVPEPTPHVPKMKPGNDELGEDADCEDRFVRNPATGEVQRIEIPPSRGTVVSKKKEKGGGEAGDAA